MRQSVTDREGWQVEAKPGTMNHLKQFMKIALRLFDLEKCRAIARSLEKVRVPFR